MTLRDLALIAIGNLWRMKLRALLTISGVLIAITAFVAMLSFGVGNQQNVEREFNKLGLLTTMQVYPRNRPSDMRSTLALCTAVTLRRRGLTARSRVHRNGRARRRRDNSARAR